MSPGLPTLYVGAIVGLLIIAASFLMLWKRRIVLDRTTKKVTEIELPFGIKGTIQARAPIVMLIGGAPLLVLYHVYAHTGQNVRLSNF